MKKIILLSSLFTFLLFASHSLEAQAKKKRVKNFSVERVINAPADQVWAVVGEDYGAIAKSHPAIISSNYINGTLKAEEGAQRVCNFNEKGTRYLHEKMMNYDPQNYTFRNQVFQAGKFPVNPDYTFAIYKVEAIDAHTSKLIFDMTYRTKPSFLGGMMKRKFKNLINDYAIAIEHHVRTGEAVNKDNFKFIKKQYAAN